MKSLLHLPNPSSAQKRVLKIYLTGLKGHNLSPSKVLAVMESSNNFWERLFFLLVAVGIQTSVVNPRLIKDLVRSLNLRAKTDKLDAKVIALYGVRMKHYFNYPRYPKGNAYVERFIRSLQEDFVDFREEELREDLEGFNRELMDYLLWYNTEREHIMV